MKIIILAGGGGTRLFPLSRRNFPKQFLNIDSDLSLLAQTADRYLGFIKPKDMIIVTNDKCYDYVKEELRKCNALDANIIKEPIGRNTAPAIGLAVKFILDKLNAAEDEILFVAPSDHIIRPKEEFILKIADCINAAKKNKVVTLGVKPNKAETGYGYIKAGREWGSGFKADKFIEKPDKSTAEEYVNEGNYFWNSGMFSFSIKTFLEELKEYEKELYEFIINRSFEQLLADFKKIKSISIDNAIAERSNRVITIPLDILWNDVGSWDAIYDLKEKDDCGNVKDGDCEIIDCRNSLFISDQRLLVGIGLEDIIAVETDDVIMLVKKGESQKVKSIVEKLKDRNETIEPLKFPRPWGEYKILSEGQGYKVKKMLVSPGKKLSLQSHKHRSEHWVVIKGEASIIVGGDDVRVLKRNESAYVPKMTLHRLMNQSSKILEVIEVQNGEYLGEDDIERFDDIYGRGI